MFSNHTHRIFGHYRELKKFWYCYKCGSKNSSNLDVCKGCGEKLLIRMTVEPIDNSNIERFREENHNLTENETIEPQKSNFNLKYAAKILIHGILFSFLYLILFVGWAFALLILVSLGSFIGLGIGVGLLFLGIGYINTALGVHLWNIDANTKFWSILFHGLILTVILVIVGLVISYLPNEVFPGLATKVITFFFASFLYGIIGKEVASWFV